MLLTFQDKITMQGQPYAHEFLHIKYCESNSYNPYLYRYNKIIVQYKTVYLPL